MARTTKLFTALGMYKKIVTGPWSLSWLRDARHYQIITLAILLGLNGIWNDFHASLIQGLAAIGASLVTQYVAGRMVGLGSFDFRSPLITGGSLALLLRANDIWPFVVAGVVAIATKFLIRVNDKHIFNPSNIAIVLLLLLLPDVVWISPGQWGREIWVLFLLSCLAFMVLYRCGRMDVSLFFLGAYALILFGRAAWLGDPWVIPLHHLSNGALLLFAFFMISDPKTIPDARVGRLVFAVTVAVIAVWLQIEFRIREGVFYALPLVCLCTPLLDRIWRGVRFVWDGAALGTDGVGNRVVFYSTSINASHAREG